MKGSFTVELSIIFPIIFIILIALLQCGLYFTYRIYTVCVMNQSLMICEEERKRGAEADEAIQSAEEYLRGRLELLPIQLETMEYQATDSWLEEGYTVGLTAQYSLIIPLHWSCVQKSTVMNPVLFQNRVDFVWEKGKQLIESWEVE